MISPWVQRRQTIIFLENPENKDHDIVMGVEDVEGTNQEWIIDTIIMDTDNDLDSNISMARELMN